MIKLYPQAVEMEIKRGKQFIPADHARIRYIGRVDFSLPHHPRFDWPGVSIEIRFSGSGCGICLSDGGNDYNVMIDHQLYGVWSTRSEQPVYWIGGMADGPHVLNLNKRTEGCFGVGIFHGFFLEPGDELLSLPEQFSRRIEFIGDSLTCGYGNECPGIECPLPRSYENQAQAFAAMVARDLHAEMHCVAISGKGLVRNHEESAGVSPDPLPYYYDRVLQSQSALSWGFQLWVPDAVVIYLGNNDFHHPPYPDKNVFVSAYHGLIARIKQHYPHAYFFCLSSHRFPGLINAVQQVVQKKNLEDPGRFHTMIFAPTPPNELGCDYHPLIAGHRRIANQLKPLIQTTLGW